MQIDVNLLFSVLLFLLFLISIILLLGVLVFLAHKKSPNSQLARPKNQSTVAQPIYPNQQDTKPIRIIFGRIDSPLAEIKRYKRSASDTYEEIHLDKETLSGVSRWFQQAPNLAQSVSQMASNTYILTFNPAIKKGLADGSLKLMESLDGGIRAIAVDKNNNVIKGVGSLKLATGIKSIASAMAIWQVLAIVTSQKFLLDIDKQLIKINKQLQAIKDFLEYQQYAKLIGSLKYIEEFYDTLNSQRFEHLELGVFLTKIEDIEQECNQVMTELELEMDDVLKQSEEERLTAIINITENFINFKDLIISYGKLSQTYLIGIAVKCLGYQTRFAIPSNHDLTLKRLSTLYTDLSNWNEHQQKFFQLVDRRLPELSSLTNNGEKEQTKLKQIIGNRKTSLEKMYENIYRFVSQTERDVRYYIEETSQPVSLLVELNEDGQINKTWKLHKNNLRS